MQKSHKDDYFITKAYWLIKFLDIIEKALKLILVKKIGVFTKFYSVLSKTHFNDCHGISSRHIVYYLVKKIFKRQHKKKDIFIFMLDVTSTFNNIFHKKFFHNFRKRYIDLKVVDWILSFISNRSIFL